VLLLRLWKWKWAGSDEEDIPYHTIPYNIVPYYTIPYHKSDLREIGGSVLLCFFAAIDSSGGGLAKSGLKNFVTQKLTAWQRF
jgi:hypothetical protein